MKSILSIFLLLPLIGFSQITPDQKENALKITQLIDQYSKARESQDTVLLKEILTEDIDQLVSSGEWRNGLSSAIEGMQRSSKSNPGTRTLKVEKIKYLSDNIALADCRYSITSLSGEERNMWSSFVLIQKSGKWKISAIRNMNPSTPNPN